MRCYKPKADSPFRCFKSSPEVIRLVVLMYVRVFAAVGGAQLMARSRADIALFDGLIESFVKTGLILA